MNFETLLQQLQITLAGVNIFNLMLIYLAVVSVSLGAHAVLYFFRKTYQPRRTRSRDRWIRWFRSAIESAENHRESSSRGYRLTGSQLRRLQGDIEMAGFADALAVLQTEREDVSGVILANADLLATYGRGLRRETIKAYFAYIIADLNRNGRITSDNLSRLMIEYVEQGQSVYTRENALKAIYTFRDARCVADAWKALSQRGLYHSSKLLGNELTEFQGDVYKAADLLMQEYRDLGEHFKVALINTLRLRGISRYDLRLAEELQKEDTSVDVKCCILRLLGRNASVHEEQLVEILRRYQNSEEWQLAAVASTALRGVRSTASKKVLKEALRSPHWHVRDNAARTLVDLDLSQEEKDEVLEGDDRFAADVLRWALNQKESA